jgi:regulator of sigma E protease
MPTKLAPASTDLLSANDHVTSTQLVIAGVAPQTPAALAGLKAGDEVLSLRVGAATTDAITTPSAGEMQDFVARHGTKAIALEYKRGGEVQVVQVTPEMGSNQTPAIGVNLAEVGLIKLSPPQALWFGAKLTGRLTVLTVTTFANFIYTTIVGTGSLSDLTGPVGLVSLVGDAANLGWVYLLTFTALISVNLAVINLLPIPALDGGRLLCLLRRFSVIPHRSSRLITLRATSCNPIPLPPNRSFPMRLRYIPTKPSCG